jgi:hypothetical protein
MKYSVSNPIIFIVMLIPAFVSSCDSHKKEEEKLAFKVSGTVEDIITHEPLNSAMIDIYSRKRNGFMGEYYDLFLKRGYSEPSGSFSIDLETIPYSLSSIFVKKDQYLDFQRQFLPLDTLKKSINIRMLPYGYVNIHMINKIDSAKLITIKFLTYYGYYQTGNFADTTIIVKTAGGIINRMQISAFFDFQFIHERVIKDTSFLTLRFDTVYINKIILN